MKIKSVGSRSLCSLLAGVLSAFLAPGATAQKPAVENQKFNLSEPNPKPRFPLKDITWPEKAGDAEICLWRDDKLAALSLGVDDNFPGEINWWKEQAKLYDFKVTWFVITGRILTEGRGNGGLWSQYQELENLGHAVESHTVTHLHVAEPDWGTPEWTYAKAMAAKRPVAPKAKKPDVSEDGETPAAGSAPGGTGATEVEVPSARPSSAKLAAARLAAADTPATDVAKGVAWEYAQSIADIEKNLPGKKVSALAYPGGKNTIYNDRKIAAKYFRVARGTTGAPNMANQIDYMSTNALSGWDFDTDRGSNPLNVIDSQRYRGRYYRGWVILFAHGTAGNPGLFAKTFEFIKANREKLWLGLYTDVAKYGQERDTATLKVVSSTEQQIQLELTDLMDDTYFTYPLTVKVRLPDGWKAVGAKQGGKDIGADIITHEGATYALVQVVPDAGVVTLSIK